LIYRRKVKEVETRDRESDLRRKEAKKLRTKERGERE